MTSVNKETKETKENNETKEKVYPKLSEIPQMLCEIYLAETQKKRENSTWYDNYYDDIKAVIKKYLDLYQKDNYTMTEDSVGNIMIEPKESCLSRNTHIILSAHMDKVHTNGAVHQLYYDEKSGKMFAHNKDKKQTSLGADDKNGIFTILEMFKRLPTSRLPSVIFTVDEESGCKGSAEVPASFFTNKRECIVIDRRNRHDLIYKGSADLYGLYLPMMFKKINPSYSYTIGSISDANTFRDYCDCMNVSCGYYNPHSSKEYTQLDELLETCDAVEKYLLYWDTTLLSGEDILEYKDTLDAPAYSYKYNSYSTYSTYNTNNNNNKTTNKTTTTPSTTKSTAKAQGSKYNYNSYDDYDNYDNYDCIDDCWDSSDDSFSDRYWENYYKDRYKKYEQKCPACGDSSYNPETGNCWYCGYVGKNFKIDPKIYKKD